jgi:hypothetical protein
MKKAASMGAKRELCAMGTLMEPEAHSAWMRHWRRMKVEEFAAAHQFGRHWKSTGHVAIGDATRDARTGFDPHGSVDKTRQNSLPSGGFARKFLARAIMWR